MSLYAIASVDLNNAIGNNGRLLCRIPEDMQHFRLTTINHVVIMGSATYKSIGKTLDGRTNIVLSQAGITGNDGVYVCSDLDRLVDQYRTENTTAFVIGGASIYEAFLPHCRTLYLTRIKHEFVADRYFPEYSGNFTLNAHSSWELDPVTGYEYRFEIYGKNKM